MCYDVEDCVEGGGRVWGGGGGGGRERDRVGVGEGDGYDGELIGSL